MLQIITELGSIPAGSEKNVSDGRSSIESSSIYFDTGRESGAVDLLPRRSVAAEKVSSQVFYRVNFETGPFIHKAARCRFYLSC